MKTTSTASAVHSALSVAAVTHAADDGNHHTTPQPSASPALAPATRVSATPDALELIKALQDQHGPLLFHQSGGCCDGSAPMCFPVNEFMIGDSDVRLGEIGGANFYMHRSQFAYWEHTHLIIDTIPGSGGMFSLERPSGLRFITRSRLYSDEEFRHLPPV